MVEIIRCEFKIKVLRKSAAEIKRQCKKMEAKCSKDPSRIELCNRLLDTWQEDY